MATQPISFAVTVQDIAGLRKQCRAAADLAGSDSPASNSVAVRAAIRLFSTIPAEKAAALIEEVKSEDGRRGKWTRSRTK